ncbi:hypothetical protein EON64_04015 [archaeon]|nr:MAG: hypothetical protein EON64_04015 [archaeon]
MAEVPSEQSEYIYENYHVSFSALRERRFALVWKPWSARCVRITPAGVLSFIRPKIAKADPHNKSIPKHKQFLLEKVEVSLLADNQVADDTTDLGRVDIWNSG